MPPSLVRIDSGGAIIKKPYRSPQGHLRVDCYATRVGVFRYYNEDGSYRDELRHPDQVFDPLSLATLGGVPVTLKHPPELATPDNFEKYGTGIVGDEVEAINPYVKVSLNLQRRDVQAAIEDGMREVSLGYLTDAIPEKGEWEGQPYTHRQIGVLDEDGKRYIKYNHLAVVEAGRAGSAVKIHFDGVDNVAIANLSTNLSTVKNKPMATLRVDESVSFNDVDPLLATSVAARFNKDAATITEAQENFNRITTMLSKAGIEDIGDAVTMLSSALAMLEQVKGENTALKAENENATKEVEEAKAAMGAAIADAADINSKVQARIALEKKAELLIPPGTKLDSLSDIEVITTALKAKYPSVNLDGMSEEKLAGMWAIATTALDSTTVIREAVSNADSLDSRDDRAKTARELMSANRTKKKGAK